MLTLLKIIHFNPGLSDSAQDQLLALLTKAGASLPGVRSAAIGKALPRALNGGQIMWRMAFASEADYWACQSSPQWQKDIAPALASDKGITADTLVYKTPFSDTSYGRDRPGIWRCLVFAVEPNAKAEDARQLERDTLLMPGHVSVIKNWAMGHVIAAEGRRRWTHVWEQEFDSVQGLEGEYMTHPIHWGLVDGWFDPECPQRVVDPFLIHAAMDIDKAVII